MKTTPVVDTDKADLKVAYAQAITDLETIQSADLNTNAKLQQAVKGMALIVERMLKVLKRRI